MATNPWYHYRSNVVKAVKKWVKQGSVSSKHITEQMMIFKYSCILPRFQDETFALYLNHIVDAEVTADLKGLKSLNWCRSTTTLHAVKIPQDHQSLYHSVSVSLWGIPDYKSVINSMIKATFKLHCHFWEKRFTEQAIKFLKAEDSKSINERVLPEHIYILANILQRPIIVVSNEDTTIQPEVKHGEFVSFYGAYLPLMPKPINCSKTPIFLAFHNNFFYPLLFDATIDELKGTFESKYRVTFPLVRSDFSILPVKFLQYDEEIKAGELLQDYLKVKELDSVMPDGSTSSIHVLFSECDSLPTDKNVMLNYMKTFLQSDHERPSKQSKMSTLPFKVFKNLSKRYKDTGIHTEMVKKHSLEFSNDLLLPEFPAEEGNDGLSNTRSHDTFNQNESAHGMNENNPIIPNAPDVEEVPLSMTNDRCISCNSYRSSANTFPFCHECYDNKSVNKNDALCHQKDNFNMDNDFAACTSISDQHEMHVNFSKEDTNNSSVSPAQKDTSRTDKGNKGQKNHSKVSAATEEFLTTTSKSDKKIDKVSSDLSSHHSDMSKDAALTKCASPVCNKGIIFPEVICEQCINILTVHHSSGCYKSCCKNPDPENKTQCDSSKINMNTEGNVSMTTNISMAPVISQPILEVEEKCSTFIPDENSNNEYKQNEIVCTPEEKKPECDPQKMIIASESVNGKFIPQSLIVTSITSVDDTNHMMNICSGGIEFPETENASKHESVKCKSMQCSNFGNQNKNGMCDMCYSGKKGGGQNSTESDITHEYGQLMEHFEYAFKTEASKCRKHLCSNFGSKLKDGFCNVCY